jgi:LacI family transcriptional regulator
VSIAKVAALAGVSKSTVSLVVNNSPAILPQTAARVRDAMRTIGYVPRPRELRRGPKQHRTLRLTLVTLGIPNAVLRAPLYSNLLHGLSDAAREQHHHLAIQHVEKPREFTALDVSRCACDGFILFGQGEPAAAVQALIQFPCVSVMRTTRARNWCDWVSYNDSAVGTLAAEHLLEKGHRTCAYVGDAAQGRGKAFVEALQAAGARVTCFDHANLVTARDDLHRVDSYAVNALVLRLRQLEPKPTGLFIWADMLTAALYPALHQQGLVPGRDLTVVSCNNEWPLLFGLRPRPAVVDIQGVAIGRRAVEQLLWRMQHRDESPVSLLLEPTLIGTEEDGAGGGA